MASWDGIVATDPPYNLTAGSGASAKDNLDALQRAYRDATSATQPLALLIPAGDYKIQLPDTGDAVIDELSVPIIGAGSSVTILRFEYGSTPPAESRAFQTAITAEDARLEGLQLVGPDLGGAEPDGSDARACCAVHVTAMSKISVIDVKTSLWYEAVRLQGTAIGATAYLERCYIKSRGTRIRHVSPTDAVDAGGLTLIDCTIEQDANGFTSTEGVIEHYGVLQEGSGNLHVMGGASLGGPNDAIPCDICSSGAGKTSASASQVAISDHYFGTGSRVGVRLSPAAVAVQIDNCVFAGESGIVLGGASTTWHVSNCAFVGGRTGLSIPDKVNAGSSLEPALRLEAVGCAVRDDEGGEEVEAYFSNCRFGAARPAGTSEDEDTDGNGEPQSGWEPFPLSGFSARPLPTFGYESSVVRSNGTASKLWSFSNCRFGALRANTGRHFKAKDGVNAFHHCRFEDDRQDDESHPVEQNAGRIELRACWKEGPRPLYFPSNQDKFLEIVLEDCVFRQDSLLLAPGAATHVTGCENELGDHVTIDPTHDADLVESDLQVKRGRGRRRVDEWRAKAGYFSVFGPLERRNGDSPERVYELTSTGISGDEGPSGTDASIADGTVTWRYVRDDADYDYDAGFLTLSWNADFVEIDETGTPRSSRSTCARARVRTATGSSAPPSSSTPWTTSRSPTQATSSSRPRRRKYRTGMVATLRYSARECGWVLV